MFPYPDPNVVELSDDEDDFVEEVLHRLTQIEAYLQVLLSSLDLGNSPKKDGEQPCGEKPSSNNTTKPSSQ